MSLPPGHHGCPTLAYQQGKEVPIQTGELILTIKEKLGSYEKLRRVVTGIQEIL